MGWQIYSSKSHCMPGSLGYCKSDFKTKAVFKKSLHQIAWMSPGMTFIMSHLHDVVNTNTFNFFSAK